MMQDKKYAMQYEAKAGYMYDKVNRLIASYIIDYYRQYVILEVADLINMIDDQDIVKRILEISSLHLPQLESNQAIDDYKNLKLNELNNLNRSYHKHMILVNKQKFFKKL